VLYARVFLQKRNSMTGKLSPAEVEELIHQELIGRLGCHADGRTYVVPMSYAYEDGFIYGHALEGMKVNMMRTNPHVCFEVDDTKNLANWKSVIAWGKFEELTGGPLREAAVRLLENRVLPLRSSETMHLSPQWPFPSDKASDVKGILFRIRLDEKTGRFESTENKYFYAT
jgi:nitroimidazol reductase NimA-like FMN-containing flavoprotein (pyridoxamine 5'-phosphate oxidase superfamily)